MRAMFADGGPRHALLVSGIAGAHPLPVEAPVDSIAIAKALIYPNPAADVISVDTRSAVGDFLVVMNRVGQVVIRQKIILDRATIRVSDLKSGIYFIMIGQGGSVHRFVKAR